MPKGLTDYEYVRALNHYNDRLEDSDLALYYTNQVDEVKAKYPEETNQGVLGRLLEEPTPDAREVRWQDR